MARFVQHRIANHSPNLGGDLPLDRLSIFHCFDRLLKLRQPTCYVAITEVNPPELPTFDLLPWYFNGTPPNIFWIFGVPISQIAHSWRALEETFSFCAPLLDFAISTTCFPLGTRFVGFHMLFELIGTWLSFDNLEMLLDFGIFSIYHCKTNLLSPNRKIQEIFVLIGLLGNVDMDIPCVMPEFEPLFWNSISLLKQLSMFAVPIWLSHRKPLQKCNRYGFSYTMIERSRTFGLLPRFEIWLT